MTLFDNSTHMNLQKHTLLCIEVCPYNTTVYMVMYSVVGDMAGWQNRVTGVVNSVDAAMRVRGNLVKERRWYDEGGC
jgi:hypothetical protein